MYFGQKIEFLPKTLIFESINLCNPILICQHLNPVGSTNISLKYQRFTLSGCTDLGIGKFEFVSNTQFLSFVYLCTSCHKKCFLIFRFKFFFLNVIVFCNQLDAKRNLSKLFRETMTVNLKNFETKVLKFFDVILYILESAM